MAGTEPIEALLAQAADRRRSGDPRQARTLIEGVLARTPGNPRALNALGNVLLDLGEVGAARASLEQAASLEPGAAPVWYNLSLVCSKQGDPAGEEAALRSALVADPYFIHALLGLGRVLARTGRPHAAAAEFRNAIEASRGIEDMPPALAGELARIEQQVAQDSAERAAFYRNAVRDRLGTAALQAGTLADDCLELFAGTRKAFHSEPVFLHFPGLPSIQFFERSQFAWLAAAEAQTAPIREEYHRLRESGATGFVPYVSMPKGKPLNQWEELNNNAAWDSFHLWQSGKRFESNCRQCPATMAMIEAIDQPRIADNAPNLMFSRLQPRTHIPPHNGMTNTRLVVHLPLVVPQGAWFRVGNDRRSWREGEAWVFDDTIEHEAANPGESERIVLIWDIWHPMLTAGQREIVTALVEAHNVYEADGGDR